jgi:hypothetical protein
MRGFLGYLSHECRVPLQVVLAGLEVLSGADGGSSLDGGECFFYFFLFPISIFIIWAIELTSCFRVSCKGSMEDCDSDTGTTNGTTGGPLTRSRSKGRLHEPSLNSCRRVQDALGVRLSLLPLYFRISYFVFISVWAIVLTSCFVNRVLTDTPLTCALCRWRRGPSTTC